MNFLKIFCGFLLVFINIGCDNQSNIPDDIKKTYPKALSILISNPLDIAKDDAEVKLNVEKIKEKEPQFNEKAFIVWSGLKEIPSQVVDADDDKQSDFITFVLNLAPHEQNEISFLFSTDGEVKHDYKKRTQAELSHKFGGEFVNRKYVGGGFQNVSYLKLPPEHTDHSDFIRYEGPGWESDKVGYRFYLDWRNAIDIFGKKVSNMVLKNVGHDEYDSYHNPADWGMDILKVGESLGVGSIAMWEDGQANRVAVTDSVDCAILANGPLYSQIRTRYFGWKVGSGMYNLISDLSITAGSRMTKNQLQIKGEAYNLCSGLAKHEATEYFQSNTDQGGWGYIALYGQQSLAGDNLGTAVLFDTRQLIEINEDELNHVVVLKPYQNHVTYYFLAAWEQEPEGIKSMQAFQDYLDQTIKAINTPLVVLY
jgi:hypothetical protein